MLVLLLHSGPDTPLFRALRTCLVERLAGKLSALKRHNIILLILLPAIFLAGGQLIVLFGPEFLMLYATNLAFYLDAMIVSSLLAAATTVRSATRRVRARLHNLLTRLFGIPRPADREARTGPVAATRAENDDDDWRSSLMAA